MSWQSSLSALLLAAAACNSAPLDQGSEGNEGVDAGVEAGTPELPDYASSPCWGEPGTTTIYSGETHELTDVSATCRAEGERTRLYVADELWETRVTQATVNAFMHRFEVYGRANSYRPNLGVLPTNEQVFGALSLEAFPDGRLPVFVIDTENAGEGYLCGWCEQSELHLDGNLLDPLDSDKALSIAAHESVHAIHHAYDLEEAVWVDETLAEAAMTVNGFFTDRDWVDAYLLSPNVDWGPDGAAFQYGAGLLYGSYLWEQGGADLLAAITRQQAHGWEGIDAALHEVVLPRSAWELYLDMAVSIYVEDPETGFGFRSFDFDPPNTRGLLAPGASFNGQLAAYGLAFYLVDAATSSVRVSAATTGVISGRLVTGNAEAVAELSDGASMVSGGAGFVVLTATAATDYELTAE
jgi:hypothetical protein